ncbi:MAG TPA: M1 family peptidase [Phaeodactylibacter sp.]|nr:M1 family peptidase [Phaeodactylibacter sp.]
MQIIKLFLFLITILLLTRCTEPSTNKKVEKMNTEVNQSRKDTHSYAQPEAAKTKHLSLNLKADFDKKILKGFASFDIENHESNKIIFDVRDLNIEKVTIGKEETPTTFTIGKAKEFLGQPLEVAIQPTTKKVTIYYSTNPDAAAVDWLNPRQTAGKKYPFLFTQGQAILTRTWIPCQDSPGIRITYDATIQVPKELLAVMSASNPTEKNDSGVYHFEMRQPIPPYLIALAIGDLAYGEIGERTAIYAEPVLLKAAVYEFADMEKMLVAAEQLYGKYLWDRYDVIVLPPSFPFGGMENPRLTFATPTIIAGDRSLTALIAHEMAHSWSGNLVTNATWNDFWLNEGFTVYFERRIMEALYGKEYANMLAVLGYQDLEADVEDLGKNSKDTHLFLDLEGRDPDDGMTDIAYEKGAYFLMMLEQKVGREKMDDFLKSYFATHQFQTITTTEFVDYLNKNLIDKYNVDVNIDEWIYGAGIPANVPKVTTEKFALVDKAVTKVKSGADPKLLATSEWTTHEWLHFIRQLPTENENGLMKKLDTTFNFSNSGNAEILAAWFEVAIKNGYAKHILPNIEKFLVSVGRRKFLTPLYRAFKENGMLKTAKDIYKKARPNYHAVSTQTLDKLLKG